MCFTRRMSLSLESNHVADVRYGTGSTSQLSNAKLYGPVESGRTRFIWGSCRLCGYVSIDDALKSRIIERGSTAAQREEALDCSCFLPLGRKPNFMESACGAL